jgi:hypothetical protein
MSGRKGMGHYRLLIIITILTCFSEIFPPIVRIKNGLPNPYPLLFLGVNLYNTDM